MPKVITMHKNLRPPKSIEPTRRAFRWQGKEILSTRRPPLVLVVRFFWVVWSIDQVLLSRNTFSSVGSSVVRRLCTTLAKEPGYVSRHQSVLRLQ